MATRRERVILDVEDNLTPALMSGAVAAGVLDKSLDNLGRNSVRTGKDLDRTGVSATRMGRNTRGATADIDRFSGRLKAMLDVGILLGPVLSPLGAATIPVLTGAIAGLGAAGAGLGVSILALQGVGDALKALDTYQAEKSAENLQALRVEMEKMGPAGADFVRFLDSIEPELKSLQNAAREGLLPGVEDGIESLLTNLPQIRDLVSQISGAMGGLAADAGADLAGPEWEAFFEYLSTDAAPTLEQFGRTVGNFAQGFADLLVGLAPVTRDFGDGLEGLSRRFAEWAAGLENNRSFQEFVDYIRQSGPQAVAMLASLAKALAGLVQAMAPYGSVVLPALTQLLNLLAKVASTDAGSALVAAAAGLVVYTRAVKIATAAQGAFNKAVIANPVGIALAALAAFAVEVNSKVDGLESATARLNESLASGDMQRVADDLELVNSALEETAIRMYPEVDAGGSLFDRLKDSMPVLGQFDEAVDQGAALWARFTGASEDAADATDRAKDALENGRHGLFGFTEGVDRAAAGLEEAQQAAQDFQEAISELDAWLSKRGAIRNYREQIQGLAKGLKDGFNREDRENIDATAESILRVAEQIKSPALRQDFMKNARASLMELANNASPKARAEIQKVIAKLDEFGLTEPKSPKLDIDLGPAQAAIAAVKGWLNGIPDETVNVYVNRVGGMGGPNRDQEIDNQSPRTRTSGRMAARGSVAEDLPFLMTRGEAVAAATASRKAELFAAILKGSAQAGWALKDLSQKLKDAERAVARETRERDALADRRNQIRGAVSGDLSNDLFAVSEGSGNPWAAGSTPGGSMDPLAAAQQRRDRARRFIAAIRTLKGMGLDKAALSAIISEGLEATEFMAAQGQAYVSEFASTLAEANQYVAQAANMGANAVVSVAEMNAANAELREANKRLRAIEKAVDRADKNNQGGHKSTQQATGWAQNAPAAWARRRARR